MSRFICDKNFHCCNYEYADRKEDLGEESHECGHLIEVEEIKHGMWVHTDTYDMYHTPIYSCSACHHEIPTHYITVYSHCPICGAKMDGEKEDI